MFTALSGAAVLAVVMFGFSIAPFSAVLVAVAALFAFRPERSPWPGGIETGGEAPGAGRLG